MIDPPQPMEPRPSDELTEEQLRDFYDEWAVRDGNSPGYNIQKARTYGAIAWEYRQALERCRAHAGLDDPNWNTLTPLAFAARLGLIDQEVSQVLKNSPIRRKPE